MKKRFIISSSMSFLQYFIASAFLLLSILFSFKSYKILSFIFSFLFFYKSYKIYLKNNKRITEIEIDDKIVRIYNNENALIFEKEKEKLLFIELENGLIKMQSDKKDMFYLDLGINKAEIKILIGENLFAKPKKGSFFSFDGILDILDILR
jgi:hypothetical protein